MNSIIGKKEGTASVVFLTLPIIVFDYSTKSLENSGSGSIINFTLCFLLSFVMLYFIKYSFVNLNENKDGKDIFEKIINSVFLIYIIFLSFNNYSISLASLLSITENSGFDNQIVGLFLVLVSLICSFGGVESLTRTAYMCFGVFLFTIFVMCLLSFSGWDYDNIAPVFGNNTRESFLKFNGIRVFSPLMCLYFLKNHFRKNKEGIQALKSIIFIVFSISLFIIAVCILSVPYPMGKLYDFSLQGIFSIAKSGLFFHRFEIILVLGVTVISVVSSALGIYISSASISKLTNFNDKKAWCIILAFLFYITNLNFKIKMPLEFASVALYLLLLVKSFKNYSSVKKVKI